MSDVKTEGINILAGLSVTVFSLYVGSNPDWTALRGNTLLHSDSEAAVAIFRHFGNINA